MLNKSQYFYWKTGVIANFVNVDIFLKIYKNTDKVLVCIVLFIF